MTAANIIEQLDLQPHPEGGYYRRQYTSDVHVVTTHGNTRPSATTIYYLLKDHEKSHLHRIKSDELWFFHFGEPVEIHTITAAGVLQKVRLGNRLEMGEQPQLLIRANTWFAAALPGSKGLSLVSCMVTPGFDFEDFELATQQDMLDRFPNLKSEIEEYCL